VLRADRGALFGPIRTALSCDPQVALGGVQGKAARVWRSFHRGAFIMGIPSGAFVPPSPARDAGTVDAPATLSSHLCGIGCEVAQGSPLGLGFVTLAILAAVIATLRWRSGGRRLPGP
jgi:hypothetical protein